MSGTKQFENKKIVIATHVFATGPAQDLLQFFIEEKAERVLFLTHPLWMEPHVKGSGYEYYERGAMKHHAHGALRKIPDLFAYIKAVALNVFWVMQQGRGWDLYIGCNNLNALSGLILQRLGFVEKTIYYTIDYNPVRFKHRLLNAIYHWIDRLCTRYSTETWNTTHLVEEARDTYFGFRGGTQKVVPIGIWFDRFPRVPFSEVKKHTLVFMGGLVKRQGVQNILAAIPLIVEKIPDFRFLVIGGGKYLPELERQAQDLGVKKYVRFTGYVEKHEDIEQMLARCALAVLMYTKYDEKGTLNFIHFGDPGKIKSYLASGLPIIMNDVAFNARQLEQSECAVVVDNTPESIARAVVDLLNDEQKLRHYREQAVKTARQFDWRTIFSENFSRIL